MKIALIDVDSHNFPNLPLMKLSAYHKKKGDQVGWWVPLECYDIAYKSKVFDFTPDIDYTPRADQIIEGGTGYGLGNHLPYDIEHITPDYSIYPQYSAVYGFLTRGCPRQCKFCIVSAKEGKQSKQVAELKEFHAGQRNIKLLDPNLLACADRERLLQQLINSGAWVDFTQGLDIRMINKDVIALLDQIKVKILHFAWDNPKEDLTPFFEKFNAYSTLTDRRKRGVYVLTNFDSTHEEDLERIYTLRRLNYDPYVMIYDKQHAPRETRFLQRWVNNKRIFMTCDTFEEYDNRRS
jgi:hypothetical protein